MSNAQFTNITIDRMGVICEEHAVMKVMLKNLFDENLILRETYRVSIQNLLLQIEEHEKDFAASLENVKIDLSK